MTKGKNSNMKKGGKKARKNSQNERNLDPSESKKPGHDENTHNHIDGDLTLLAVDFDLRRVSGRVQSSTPIWRKAAPR